MTDDFDDDALRAAIGSRSGGSVDIDDARTVVVGRARRVRTIRTVAIGGTAVVLLIAGLLVIPTGRDTTGTPADQPDAPAPTTPTTTESPLVTTVAEPSTTMSTSGAIATAVPSSVPLGGPAPTTPTSPPPTTPQQTTVPAPVTSPTTIASVPTTSSAPVVADPPFTRRYDSPGGSITVNWNGAALSLVSVDANPGYQSEIEDQSASLIRVRFRGETDARIEVRVKDGRVESIIS